MPPGTAWQVRAPVHGIRRPSFSLVPVRGAEITVHPSPKLPGDPSRRRSAAAGAPPRISFGELVAPPARGLCHQHPLAAEMDLLHPRLPGDRSPIASGSGATGSGRPILRAPLRLAVGFLSFFVRNFYGIELYPTARIGRRFGIAHQHGIVIHKRAVIGDDCLIRQGVTIGAAASATTAAGRRGSATG